MGSVGIVRLSGGIGEGPVYLDDKKLRDPITRAIATPPNIQSSGLGARKRRKRQSADTDAGGPRDGRRKIAVYAAFLGLCPCEALRSP